MKFLFLSGLYPKEMEKRLRDRVRSNSLQEAPNNLQWAIVDGLIENAVDFEVLSLPFLPTYPMGFQDLLTPESLITDKGGNNIGKMLSYNSLVGYKDYSIRRVIKKSVSEWINNNGITKEDKFGVLVYTEYSPFILPLISLKEKYPNMTIGVIITDLIDDNHNYSSNQSLLKRIQMKREKKLIKSVIYPRIDKFILLAAAMVEKIPEAKEKNIVVEGIYNKPINNEKTIKKRSGVLFYSGTLEDYSGIRELVDSFEKIENRNIRLEICGTGGNVDYVVNASQRDERIKYLGVLARERVISLQQSATALINPRRPDNTITKYSFPSKTIEYMSSGTPMIGYKLEGIPDEYYNYMYLVEDMNVNSLSNTIKCVFQKSPNELENKGREAYSFILSKKNPHSQVKKILDFLES